MSLILRATPSRYTKALVILSLMVFAASLAVASPARAATVTVTNTGDSGPGSLRQAVSAANPGDEITFSPDLDGETITLTGGEIYIDKALTITGPGADSLAVSANNSGRIFNTTNGSASTPVVISGLTLKSGETAGGVGGAIVNNQALTIRDSAFSGNHSQFGGAIFNGATVTVMNSTFSNNSATDSCAAHGGAIFNGQNSTATVTSSTFSNNSATTGCPGTGFGAGIINNGGALNITGSTFSGNSSTSDGGGIYNASGGSVLTLTNSTLSGNNSGTIGGGIYNNGTLRATGDTISGNGAPNGAGIFTDGSVILKNTIVANSSLGGDCGTRFGSITDGGYNVSSGADCNLDAAYNSLPQTDPKLDPGGLKYNGGPTRTIDLQPDSPAVDLIPNDANGCGTTVTTDQRGASRPQGSGCDAGAFELSPNQPPVASDDSATVERGVASDVPVLVNDSDPDGETLSVDSVSTPTHGTVTINPDNTVHYTPESDYTGPDSFTYTLSDGKGATDTATVEITVTDTVPPVVESVTPRANATGVAPGSNVTVTFSEAMNQASISKSTIKLYKKGSSAPLRGVTVNYDPASHRAILDPTNALRRGTVYRALVTTGVSDLAGNQLARSEVWSFTTKK